MDGVFVLMEYCIYCSGVFVWVDEWMKYLYWWRLVSLVVASLAAWLARSRLCLWCCLAALCLAGVLSLLSWRLCGWLARLSCWRLVSLVVASLSGWLPGWLFVLLASCLSCRGVFGWVAAWLPLSCWRLVSLVVASLAGGWRLCLAGVLSLLSWRLCLWVAAWLPSLSCWRLVSLVVASLAGWLPGWLASLSCWRLVSLVVASLAGWLPAGWRLCLAGVLSLLSWRLWLGGCLAGWRLCLAGVLSLLSWRLWLGGCLAGWRLCLAGVLSSLVVAYLDGWLNGMDGVFGCLDRPNPIKTSVVLNQTVLELEP